MFNGAKLKELRKNANLTAQELADKVGSTQSMIAHSELGYKNPSVELLGRISDFFGVSMDDFMVKSTPIENAE